MKKQLFLSIFLSFFISFAYAQKQNIVKVRTADEFVKAIASNTIIEMEYGLYSLNSHSQPETQTDGSGFYVKNISNLTIKGIGKFPAELVLDNDEYATVIKFIDCNNIILDNVEIGHGASKGYCMGAVVGLKGTKNFTVKNSVLYGSGTYGIESFEGTSNVLCEKTTIRSCTYGAIYMQATNDVIFNDCNFVANSNLDIFDFNNCKNVVFNFCIIKDNRSEASDYSSQKLFNVQGNEPITLNNCLVKFNSLDYLANKMGVLKLNNTKMESNLFRKKEFEN
ncbi:MAG: right-handed parallel beta-helix repeat-containing protein [Bacteroidetes bacterium]|nr:MAG: right-handed parallel beta-helix repeat-containing protein [Bacteroidota bacterium]